MLPFLSFRRQFEHLSWVGLGFHFNSSVDRVQAVAVRFLLVGQVPVDTRNDLFKYSTFAGQRPSDRLNILVRYAV